MGFPRPIGDGCTDELREGKFIFADLAGDGGVDGVEVDESSADGAEVAVERLSGGLMHFYLHCCQ